MQTINDKLFREPGLTILSHCNNNAHLVSKDTIWVHENKMIICVQNIQTGLNEVILTLKTDHKCFGCADEARTLTQSLQPVTNKALVQMCRSC